MYTEYLICYSNVKYIVWISPRAYWPAFHCSDYAVLSNFTLAFFEDSGWYKVNYTFMNNYDQFELQWGRGM